MPVLFQKPLPDMESDAELPDHENGMRRLMRTNRRCDRDLDGLLEEERLDREGEAEARAMLERQEEQACNEETREMERQVAQWVQDNQEEREAARYQAWEDEVMRQAMEAAPARKRTYVEVELSSGSSDGPRVSRVLRVPMEGQATLQLSLAVVQQEEPVATPPNPVVGVSGVRSPLVLPRLGGWLTLCRRRESFHIWSRRIQLSRSLRIAV